MHPSQLEEDVRPDKMEVEASAAFFGKAAKSIPVDHINILAL